MMVLKSLELADNIVIIIGKLVELNEKRFRYYFSPDDRGGPLVSALSAARTGVYYSTTAVCVTNYGPLYVDGRQFPVEIYCK